MKHFRRLLQLGSGKTRRVLVWKQDRVSWAVGERGEEVRFELNRLLDDVLKELGARKTGKNFRTVLVLPKSQVFQKEMTWSGSSQDFEQALTQILPYSPREMAYALSESRSEAGQTRALLYAVPENRVKEIMDRLSGAGVTVDEVVSEEQALGGGVGAGGDVGRDVSVDRDGDGDEEQALSRMIHNDAMWKDSSGFSLLPHENKLRVKKAQRWFVWRQKLIAVMMFALSLVLWTTAHGYWVERKVGQWEKEWAALASSVAETKRIQSSLDALDQARVSRMKLLELLEEVGRRVPGTVRLKELRVEGGRVVLEGESPSQIFVTETVQAFEVMEGLKEVKLEHTRLRKRLNQEFFDFEVSGKW